MADPTPGQCADLVAGDPAKRLRVLSAWAADEDRPLIAMAAHDGAAEIERLRATSDAAAYLLLERIAYKAVEPMSEDADPSKTIGQCREELLELIKDVVSFVMARNNVKG